MRQRASGQNKKAANSYKIYENAGCKIFNYYYFCFALENELVSFGVDEFVGDI